ncbi:hypothetical protein J2S78_002963 [Salibacterium salarium]|nr:hypothetical protein [Salibacterium salarium]MDQ0300495.1 hypothetical protein [Salibacterium salarium]
MDEKSANLVEESAKNNQQSAIIERNVSIDYKTPYDAPYFAKTKNP